VSKRGKFFGKALGDLPGAAADGRIFVVDNKYFQRDACAY
jgi:hypothetical protein